MLKLMRNIFLILLALIIAGPISLYFLVRPTKTLDLKYTPVNFEQKAAKVISDYNGTVTFSETELNNMFKEQLSKLSGTGFISITGAEIKIANDKLNASINSKVKFAAVGVDSKWDIGIAGSKLVATPTSLHVGRLPLAPGSIITLMNLGGVKIPGMAASGKSISFDMNGFIPNQIKVKDIKVNGNSLIVSVEPDAGFAASLVTIPGVDRKTVQQVISTVNKYTSQAISKKTQDEILSGKISEQTKYEVIGIFSSMSPDRQKQVLQDITKQIDPSVLESLKKQFGQ